MEGQRSKPRSGWGTGPQLENVWLLGRLPAEAAAGLAPGLTWALIAGVLEDRTAPLCRSYGGEEGISPHQVVKPCLLAWQVCCTSHSPGLDPHSQRMKIWAGTTKPPRHDMGWRGAGRSPRETKGVLQCLAGVTHPGCYPGRGRGVAALPPGHPEGGMEPG